MKKSAFIFALIFCLFFSSCGDLPEGYARSQVFKLLESRSDLCALLVRCSDATAEEEYYLDEGLLYSLFGNGEPMAELSLVRECAFFIASGRNICEYYVFVCRTFLDTDAVSLMCEKRAKLLRMQTGLNYASSSAAANAFVSVKGKCVIFAALPAEN